MENKTEMGLLLIIFGLILSIISTLGSVATGDFGGTSVSASAIIPAIFGFLAFILLLVGWILMMLGRKEFGEEHAQFTMYSLVAFIVGFIVVIIGGIIMAFGMMAGGLGSISTEETVDYPAMARGMMTGLIISQIGGIIFTLGAILLVFRLENEVGIKILYLALIVSIIIAIVSIILISSAVNDLANKLEETPEDQQEDEFLEGLSGLSYLNGIAIIGTLLLLIGYYIPYDRIKKGELKPVMLPTQPYGAPPYPAQYPYQPYLPYQPGPYQQPPYQQPYPPQYPPQQPPVTPPEGGTPPSQPPAGVPVQPKEVPRETAEVISCRFCNTQIPKGSIVCPVCQKEL
ncbi:MAG: hypothetical protein JSV56_12135 [Methanomassiliicoccales archaeon]|nr:MAG: hypothetical protein JSV56_12135 [Methanomassiliicoccales archaeon]